MEWGAAQKTAVVLVLLVAFGAAAAFFATRVPSSFLPDEDQGYAYINLQLPDGASMERTTAMAAEVEKVILNTPGVKYATSVVGFSLLSYVRTSYNRLLLCDPQALGRAQPRERSNFNRSRRISTGS